MLADPATSAGIARLATATGVVALATDALLVTFFTVGEPFGTINDAGSAALGVLAGTVAWRLRAYGGAAATGAAIVGGAVVVTGSGLVISRTTGWELAGFVSSAGYGLIGPSVATISSGLAADGSVPRRLGQLGRVTGLLMTLGLVAAVPAALRFDDPATTPGWAWLTMVGWVGPAILYPVWALWLGRALGRRSQAVAAAAQAG
jgi:hypothetical protein